MPIRTRSKRRSAPPDAVALLKADHAKVSAMFAKYDHSRLASAKKKLAGQICGDLTIHMAIEEKIFYPAVRQAIGEEDLMDEATVEHAGAKKLIAEIQGGDPGDALYDAKVTVLSEYIKHHVKEEHTEMFPKARRSGIDLKELGARLAERKRELAGK